MYLWSEPEKFGFKKKKKSDLSTFFKMSMLANLFPSQSSLAQKVIWKFVISTSEQLGLPACWQQTD